MTHALGLVSKPTDLNSLVKHFPALTKMENSCEPA